MEYEDIQLTLDIDTIEKLINLSIENKINLILTADIQQKELDKLTMLSWHST